MSKKSHSSNLKAAPLTSAADAKAWAGGRAVSEIECLVPDLAGVARGKIMPSDKFFDDTGMALPSSIFLQTITGEYPEDNDDVRYDPSDGDIELRPDFGTMCVVP
jgi:glutamine synthetase